MKIAVLFKQIFVTEAKICIGSRGPISRQGISPCDEYALAEALYLKEKNSGEVTVISTGTSEAQSALCQALVMGADKALLFTDNALEYTTSEVLVKVLGAMEFDLMLAGWCIAKDGSSQVTVRIAKMLELPEANIVNKLEIQGGKVISYILPSAKAASTSAALDTTRKLCRLLWEERVTEK